MKVHAHSEEALASIKSGHRVFVQGAIATPLELLKGLIQLRTQLKNVELIHLHTCGEAAYARPEMREHFRVANLFVGSNMRPYLDADGVDYLPCFLSEIPQLFRSRRRPIDCALIHVSPPDEHGFCSLGTSVDVARAAVDVADVIIAQINPNMPRVHGDGLIHVSKIHHAVHVTSKLPEIEIPTLTQEEKRIGELCATLIEDGSTLQTGIGAIPNAVLYSLRNHKDLGLHTEMWTDSALDLIESGALNNRRKAVHPGKSVSGFLMGTQRLYDFVNDNPSVVQLDIAYVNDPRVIARNPKVVAINSAVEVDLTGQVCADSVGHQIISGVGGQMDFIRGASLSEGGKPIIAFTSRTKNGHSRIVSTLKLGAGVVTTRAHVHIIVTEFGIADLYGQTLHERAKRLIAIAHPEDREKLAREWVKLKSSH